MGRRGRGNARVGSRRSRGGSECSGVDRDSTDGGMVLVLVLDTHLLFLKKACLRSITIFLPKFMRTASGERSEHLGTFSLLACDRCACVAAIYLSTLGVITLVSFPFFLFSLSVLKRSFLFPVRIYPLRYFVRARWPIPGMYLLSCLYFSNLIQFHGFLIQNLLFYSQNVVYCNPRPQKFNRMGHVGVLLESVPTVNKAK